jgi:hypothetical protein
MFKAPHTPVVSLEDDTRNWESLVEYYSNLKAFVEAATTLGTVQGKIEVFDDEGTSKGFIPVYDDIT